MSSPSGGAAPPPSPPRAFLVGRPDNLDDYDPRLVEAYAHVQAQKATQFTPAVRNQPRTAAAVVLLFFPRGWRVLHAERVLTSLDLATGRDFGDYRLFYDRLLLTNGTIYATTRIKVREDATNGSTDWETHTPEQRFSVAATAVSRSTIYATGYPSLLAGLVATFEADELAWTAPASAALARYLHNTCPEDKREAFDREMFLAALRTPHLLAVATATPDEPTPAPPESRPRVSRSLKALSPLRRGRGARPK